MNKAKSIKRLVISTFIFILFLTVIGINNFKGEQPEALAAARPSQQILNKSLKLTQDFKPVTIQSFQTNAESNSTVTQDVYANNDIERTKNNDKTETEEIYQIDPTVADNVYGNNTKSVLITLRKTTNSVTFSNKKLNNKKSKKLKNTNTLVVDLNSTEIKNMQTDKEVAFVEADSPVEAVSKGKVIPLDTNANKKKLTTQLIPWGVSSIGADLAINEKNEGKSIKIAVLDTGITNLADLVVQDGISFVDGITDYADDNGHGTHVAGTIAALNNATGIVGTASKSKIYAVKVLDSNGSGSYGQVIQGIDWAIENKMDIISISFGGTKLSQALHDAIIKANNKGILIISAAGNAGEGVETEVYPALFPEVISVGAVDTQFKRSWFSSTGSQIDLVAPGSLILSTLKEGGYGYLSGTSMAVPHVTGAAAVLWSENKNWTNEQIKQKLFETATPLGNVHEYGRGIVNIAKALNLTNDPIAPPVNPLIPTDSKDNVNLPGSKGDVTITSINAINNLSYTTSTTNSIDINGSFEADVNNNNFPDFWETSWRNGSSTSPFAIRARYDPTDGSIEYRLNNGLGDASSYVFVLSNKIPVLPGTTYQVKAKMKYTLASTSSAQLSVIQLDAAGNNIWEDHQVFNNGGWTWHDNTNVFFTKSNTSHIVIRIAVGGEVNAFLDVDEVSVNFVIPTAPTNLSVISKTATSVNLAWSASTTVGVTEYDVYNGSTKLNTDTISGTSYIVSGLNSNTTYNFSVKAGNLSKSSNILFVTTNPDSPEADDTKTGANPIANDQAYSAYIGTATDVDFYKYTASGNGIEQITMSIPSNKNYDVYVYDANMNLIGAGIRNTGLGEEVVYKVTSGTIYYIKIFGIAGDYGTTPYSFNITRNIINFQTDYQYDNNGNLYRKITKSIQN